MVGWWTMAERDPATLHSIFGPIQEGASATYEADIVEGEGDAASLITTITSIKLTIYDQDTGRRIRRTENVLAGGEGGTLTAGHLRMEFSGDDNPVLNQRLPFEDHVALFECSYTSAGVTKTAKLVIILRVQNLRRVRGAL